MRVGEGPHLRRVPPRGGGWFLLIGLLGMVTLSASARTPPSADWVPFECTEPLRDVRHGAEPIPPDELPASDAEVARAFEEGIRDFLFDAPCPGDPYVVYVGDRLLAGEVLGVPEAESREAGAEPELPHAFDAGWRGEPVCEVLHDTETVRIGRCSFPPGVGHEKHFHRPHFGYVLTGGTMRIEDADGVETVETRAGATWTSDETSVHEVVIVGDTTTSYLIVEPKEP